MWIKFETRKRNTGFCFEAGSSSSKGYASFKQVRSWPWHVEFTPGVSVVGLVTTEELCKVVWGIIIKNFMHEYSFIVSELLR